MRQVIVIGMVGKYVTTGAYHENSDIMQYATFNIYPLKCKGEAYKVILNESNLRHIKRLLPGTIVYVSGKPSVKNDKLEVLADLIYFVKENEIENE